MANKWEMENEQEKKYFTLDEANNLIPVFEQEIICLQEIKLKFDIKMAQLYDLKRVIAKSSGSNHGEDKLFMIEAEIEFIQIMVQSHIHNIQSKGAILKDIDMGLVDFPAIINGQEAELCWKLGEKSIRYYHGVNEGFYSRKEIPPTIQ